VLFLSASLFANEQIRREKREEIRAERLAARAAALAKVQGTDAGWVSIDLENADHDYKSVHVLPGGVIWMSGYNLDNDQDVAWLSVNGGANWTKKAITPSFVGTMFDAKDQNTAVAADFGGNIHFTSDGGATWSTVYSYGSGVGFFDAVEYIDDNTVLALGDADGEGLCVAKSTDAGATWTRLNNLPAEEANPDKWFAYATYRHAADVYNGTFWCALYAGSGTNGRILKTTDAGANWTSWEIPLTGGPSTNYYLRSVNMADENIGYGVSRRVGTGSANDSWMHKTTDGGLTWSDTVQFEPGVVHADQKPKNIVPLRGTNTVLAVGFGTTGAKSWWSTDAGTTWTPVPAPGADFTGASFVDANTVFGAGYTNFARFTPTGTTRRVTFTVNTATVPDTLPVVGQTMQIRGGVNHAGGISPITWGNDAQNVMTQVGGDYWSKTMQMQVGDTLRYKYVVTYASGTGWEQGVVPAGPVSGGDRVYIVADQDTTLDVEFWNNGPSSNDQYWRPWTAVDDSFMNVYFRVSMAGPMKSGTFGFNPDVDQVGVRGGGPAGGDLNWSPTFFLTREQPASNGDGYTVPANTFWSGRVRIPKSGVTEGQEIAYKYLIGDDWGRDELQGQPNRSFRVPVGLKDTTLAYSYFNNEKPTSRTNSDTMIVTFRTNLAKASSSGGFTVGVDTIEVQTGWFGTAAQIGRPKRLQQVIGSVYQVTDTIVTSKDALLDYQYYVYRDGVTVRETYYNFNYSGQFISEAERRQVLVPGTGNSFTVLDTATSVTQDRRQPQFPNSRRLAQNVLVTWTVDLRPAIYQVMAGDTLNDIQGSFNVTPADKDSILGWGVWMNGPAVGGWSNPGGDWGLGLSSNPDKKLFDDGSNGDAVAGDSVFTRQVLASPDSIGIGTKSQVGQVFKFGIRGGDNEGGKGGFGNNHNENIVDTAPTYTLESQFGSINPAFYDAWDYDAKGPATGVIDPNQPLSFELAQNYPNPFNPSTRIQYAIPAQAKVVLKVYNVVGQEVATLVNEVLPAGVHSARFEASSLATGVYLYRLTAGDFTSVKKMLLLK
jgi:photosystem II stability/assembly factor-like uncharacterized protein